MKNIKIGKVFALLLSFSLIFTSAISGTLAFLSVNTSEVKNTFIPFDSSASDLIISKKVEHPLGEDYKIPDNISFDFKVELGSYYAGYTVSTTAGSKTADKDGNIIVSIKPNASISIQGLDDGTPVRVTELEHGGGFSIKGEAAKNVVISTDEFAKAEFVNIYTPEKTTSENITLAGTKTLSGRDWKQGDSFSFILEQQTADGWKTLSEKTVIYSQNTDFNRFDFTDAIRSLSFDKVGKYAFRVSEKVGALAGIDYDRTVNYFYIHVTDADMDGKLEIGNVTAEQNAEVTGEFDVNVTFNNAYTLPDDIKLSITANKTVKNFGSKAIGPENFSFVLAGSGDELTAKSDKNGKAVFNLAFGYEDIGKTYIYKLSEVNDGRKGVTYSTAVYTVAVKVSLSNNNKLIAAVTVNGKPYSLGNIIFENTYESKLDTPITGESSVREIEFAILLFAIALAAAYIARRRKTRKVK